MNVAATYVEMNEWIVSCLGDAHALAHVHVGLAIYVIVQVFTRDRRASIQGLICVLGAELANEIIEAAHYGSMRWGDTLGDIAMTLFWQSCCIWSADIAAAAGSDQARRARLSSSLMVMNGASRSILPDVQMWRILTICVHWSVVYSSKRPLALPNNIWKCLQRFWRCSNIL